MLLPRRFAARLGRVKPNLKPANSKARALLEKLQALAERGIDGEKASAQKKIARLKQRFDFGIPDIAETPDLFQGSFRPARKARRIYAFGRNEFDVANSVKWAIESATGVQCLYRDGELMAEVSKPSANRLTDIAEHIAGSFRALLARLSAVEGISVDDRSSFVMGLYDGMMNEVREVGARLPSRVSPVKTRKGKKRPATGAIGLNIHPYTVALSLGKQIRFSAPPEQVAAELDAVLQKSLTPQADWAVS